MDDIRVVTNSVLTKMDSGEIARRDDVILCHWGSAMLQLSVSDLDSIDRVVALAQWAALAFTEKARRDQAKCFLCELFLMKLTEKFLWY